MGFGMDLDLERRSLGIWIPAPSANKQGEIKAKLQDDYPSTSCVFYCLCFVVYCVD